VYSEICKHCKNLNREITELSWRHILFQNPNMVNGHPVCDETVEKIFHATFSLMAEK
jgi:hypothetical protein